jgi:uncharacterized protein
LARAKDSKTPRALRSERKKDLSKLRAFLDREGRPDDAMGFIALQGFLFALCCAPDLVQPSEWYPIVFGEHGPGFETREQAQELLGALMALYNDINDGVLKGAPELPKECVFRDPPTANFDDDAPVSQWSRGFGEGHMWLSEVWDEALPDEFDEELGSLCMVLTCFASRGVAESYVREAGEAELTVEKFAALMSDLVPQAMHEYAHIGRATYEAWMSAEKERSSQAQTEPKVGRNDPCPCGSGKKYKRCHGLN